MKDIILFDTEEYIAQVTPIIERNSDRKKYIDTSFITNPPMAVYDWSEGRYYGYNLARINAHLHRIFKAPNYEEEANSIRDHMSTYSRKIIDLIKSDFLVPPTVYTEMNKKIQNIHKTQQGKVTTLSRAESGIKKITNRMLSIEKDIADSVKNIAKGYKDEIESTTLKYSQLYDDIYKNVYDAFMSHKEIKSKRQGKKRHNDSISNPKILSEIMLYSHIKQEKAAIITYDSDFFGTAKFLSRKKLKENIYLDMIFIQVMQNSSVARLPFFKRQGILYYNADFYVREFKH